MNLINPNENALATVGKVTKFLRQAGASEVDISNFITEATSGDYEHLLSVCRKHKLRMEESRKWTAG